MIQYSVYQDNRKNGTKLFYGRATHLQTIDENILAERIQRNCSMKKSDVLAVLCELVEVMNDELQNSNKVKLNGLGTFSIGIRSTGAMTEEDYKASENIKGFKVRFLPEAHKAGSKFVRTFLDGIKVIKVNQ